MHLKITFWNEWIVLLQKLAINHVRTKKKKKKKRCASYEIYTAVYNKECLKCHDVALLVNQMKNKKYDCTVFLRPLCFVGMLFLRLANYSGVKRASSKQSYLDRKF